MRTTVRLDDQLLEQAKKEADREGKSFTALLDQALRQRLARSRHPVQKKRVRIPVSRSLGGTLPGIDLDDSASLLEILENRK